MRRQLLPALAMLAVFTVLTGLVYPMVVTGIAQGVFKDKADASFVEVDDRRVGSSLIGQPFTGPKFFHPRPSAAGDGYDGAASSGSNVGPTNDEFLYGAQDDPSTPDENESFDGVEQRIAAFREENSLPRETAVPVDAVTASGSGLDPHISVANARLQSGRVARERGFPRKEVLALVNDQTDGRGLGFLGEPAVNVLELNLALDKLPARR